MWAGRLSRQAGYTLVEVGIVSVVLLLLVSMIVMQIPRNQVASKTQRDMNLLSELLARSKQIALYRGSFDYRQPGNTTTSISMAEMVAAGVVPDELHDNQILYTGVALTGFRMTNNPAHPGSPGDAGLRLILATYDGRGWNEDKEFCFIWFTQLAHLVDHIPDMKAQGSNVLDRRHCDNTTSNSHWAAIYL